MAAAVIYTDGAYAHSRDVGGWAALIDIPGDQANITYGRVRNTTSNRMEMVAIISALKAIKTKDAAVVFTDSELTVKCFNEEYEIKSNLDLWADMAEQVDRLANVVLKHLPRNSIPQLEEADGLSKQMTAEDCRTPEFTSYGSIPPATPEGKIPNDELRDIVADAVAEAEAGGEPDATGIDASSDDGDSEERPDNDESDSEASDERDQGVAVEKDGTVDGEFGKEPGEPASDTRPASGGVSGSEDGGDGGDDADEPPDPSDLPVAIPVKKRRKRSRKPKTKIGTKKA